ncbi:oligopeptide transport system permease protein [Paenibacillus phyllosphaerae]|uniref:Oligopeptide transport system permease protein n=1 Tax=Paenibacillus phyllosphaerae TaxID=274593 RepID=A0A7W5AXL6_9BACL|nr:ABC transporter permease [Paenibacillus phyllosphaerae]MBB3110643.1 oligopeptide transport system permease protein [Paenibacillus phyllosphaerae]
MFRYVLRKLVNILLSLFVLATATFFLMKAIPGDPFMQEKNVPAAVRENLIKYYGFDKPLWHQYLIYLKNLLNLDLGMSMRQQYQSVVDIITRSFKYSLQLGVVAIIVSVVVGVAIGLIAALYNRKLIDRLIMLAATVGIAVPNFVLATLGQYYFANKLRWFHVAGLHGPMDYVLPTLALSVLPIAFIARLTRSTMIEVLAADYIRTAKAKGLGSLTILIRHALRNGLLPVVSYVGPMTANIITGSVVVESIFGIAGLGKFFTDSVSNRDYTLIMGITLFYAAILMASRFITDIAYAIIDPRIKISKKGG